uniref:Guanylate kinase 1b n=1 Tax=Fundulus heteroclitus TaxID=8078 RepID=A0A3Q2QDZ5_FUNHE
MSGPRPVVLSGPSGAGKSTLLKRLMKDHEGVFGFSVSHTTRNPRPGEEDGKGLNNLPMLLGATLLPVADVFSSETSFSCPNESEPTVKGPTFNPLYILDRQTETEESLQKRLEAARIDMELSKEAGVFDIVIVNDDLEKAYEELKEILNEEIKKVQEAK